MILRPEHAETKSSPVRGQHDGYHQDYHCHPQQAPSRAPCPEPATARLHEDGLQSNFGRESSQKEATATKKTIDRE